jgi:C4-dicarboxylate transporter DctM subunit
MPVIILGGIYGGIFTATEAAVIAVFYGFFVGFFIYKELKIKDLPKLFESTVIGTAIVMFIMNAAGLFSWMITLERVPAHVAEYFISLSKDPTVFLILFNLMMLIVGCFLNASAAITILTPILLPIVLQLGIDPIFFGVIMTTNLAIGCLTPPVGVDLYVACSISKVSLTAISKAIVPFVFFLIVLQVIVTQFPIITMWLVNYMK